MKFLSMDPDHPSFEYSADQAKRADAEFEKRYPTPLDAAGNRDLREMARQHSAKQHEKIDILRAIVKADAEAHSAEALKDIMTNEAPT